MKRRILSAVITICMLFAFCIMAAAMQTDPAAPAFRLLGVSPTDMETASLTLGVGDDVTLRIYADSASLADCTFALQYDKSAFTYGTTSVNSYSGDITTTAVNNADGSVAFTCDLSDTASFSGSVLLATVYFDTKADISQTAYSFTLTDGTTALSLPVTATVTHNHAFSTWRTISVSIDGTMQTQKRDCIQCGLSETREIAFVDYSISLKNTAKNIRYNKEERLLYAIAPDTTVGTLLDSLTAAGDMQVIDKNGVGLSRNDKLATGMTVLVMDDGEVEATVEFSASVSVWGDADGDGSISATDARLALRRSVDLEKTLTKAQCTAIDSNLDAAYTAADARFILRVCVGLEAFYNIPVSAINLSQTSLSLSVGQSSTLTYTVVPADASVKGVSWKSSDAGVATVSNGTVKAIGAGTAVITATAQSGVTKTCTVTVIQPVESVTYKRVNFYLPENTSIDLSKSFTVSPANASTANCTWAVSDSNFTVANGVVRCSKAYSAVANKTVTVTCTFAGGKKATFKVTLIPAGKSYCLFAYENVSVSLNQKFNFGSTLSSGAVLQLVAGNTSILTVDSKNVVTAVGVGTTTLTCKGVDYSETITVNVTSNALIITEFGANTGGKALTIGFRNMAGKDIANIDFYVTALDQNGAQVETKIARIPHTIENNASKSYSWTTFWTNTTMKSAKITRIIITYADGHMETINESNIKYS